MRLLAALAVAFLVGPLLAAPAAAEPDPRWVFYTKDKTRYASPWYDGAHRKMVPYGCTRAPYYSPDPRCRAGHGFHHGLDIAMPCGTKLYAGRRGWVVDNSGLGSAYGENPLLLRNRRLGRDFLLAHTRKVFVSPGQRVTPGQLIAKASDAGAPDGCHLHFEVRDLAGGLDTAHRPLRMLRLTASE